MADLIVEQRRETGGGGAVLIWTFDRAERLNALPDPHDGDEVAALCEAANADPSVRCVILTGAGRAFSAGGDLTAMRDRRDLFEGSGAAIRERYRRVVHRIIRSLYSLDVPLIAAVNGPAMGLGCGIAGTADMIVASDRASFGAPFLKLGIIAGDGGAWRLPRNVGYMRAAELLFTSRSIDAQTALDWGLVNRVVGHEALMDEALALADQVAVQPPRAVRMTKGLLRQGRDATLDQILEMSAAYQALAHLTEDHLEGVNAVLEKRQGRFSGD